MVAVELAGDVIVFGGHVGQGFVTVAEFTVTNLTVVHVGQSLVIVVLAELGGMTVAGMLNLVVADVDPEILIGVADPDPGIVMGGQVGQGLYTVVAGPDPGIVMGGQVGQGLYTVVADPDPGTVIGGQVGQGL